MENLKINYYNPIADLIIEANKLDIPQSIYEWFQKLDKENPLNEDIRLFSRMISNMYNNVYDINHDLECRNAWVLYPNNLLNDFALKVVESLKKWIKPNIWLFWYWSLIWKDGMRTLGEKKKEHAYISDWERNVTLLRSTWDIENKFQKDRSVPLSPNQWTASILYEKWSIVNWARMEGITDKELLELNKRELTYHLLPVWVSKTKEWKENNFDLACFPISRKLAKEKDPITFQKRIWNIHNLPLLVDSYKWWLKVSPWYFETITWQNEDVNSLIREEMLDLTRHFSSKLKKTCIPAKKTWNYNKFAESWGRET